MRSASYQPSSDPGRSPLRRRAISLALTIVAHILIILLLLRLAPPMTSEPRSEPSLKTFQATQDPVAEPSPRSNVVAKVRSKSGGAAPRAPAPAAPPPASASVAKPVPPKIVLPNMIGGMEMFEAADISKLPSHAGETAAGGEANGTGSGKDSGSAYGPGEGPGGERLYNAEWYKEPTEAELAGYMPPGRPQSGTAIIACRTIANYHVENCRILSESPPGTGLARALRQAAWQFRILPPRIGGKPIIGAWVRIRYVFTVRNTRETP